MSTPRAAPLFALLLIAALVATACGEGDETEGGPKKAGDEFATPFTGAEAYPVIVSSEIVVGQNRFEIGLLNEEDAPIGSPDMDVHIDFFDLAESDTEPVTGADMDFFWLIEDVRGLYSADVSFDSAGSWGAEVAISGDGVDETLKTSFNVTEESATPAVGEPAPPSDTPTGDEVEDLSEISTDPQPDPSFYRTSIAQAVRAGEPFVVVFSTPKYCQTQVCGPTLDLVKEVAEDFPKITFIHSEIYKGLDPSTPVAPAVLEWGLPSEPWIFVVDSDGLVAAKYEGSVAPSELEQVLQPL